LPRAIELSFFSISQNRGLTFVHASKRYAACLSNEKDERGTNKKKPKENKEIIHHRHHAAVTGPL
jgi:hypothetical protein